MLKGKHLGAKKLLRHVPVLQLLQHLSLILLISTSAGKHLRLGMKNRTEKNTRMFLHICVQFRKVFQVIGLIVLLNFIAFEKLGLGCIFFPARFSILRRAQH